MKYPVREKKLIRLKFQACILLHVKSLILSQKEKKTPQTVGMATLYLIIQLIKDQF